MDHPTYGQPFPNMNELQAYLFRYAASWGFSWGNSISIYRDGKVLKACFRCRLYGHRAQGQTTRRSLKAIAARRRKQSLEQGDCDESEDDIFPQPTYQLNAAIRCSAHLRSFYQRRFNRYIITSAKLQHNHEITPNLEFLAYLEKKLPGFVAPRLGMRSELPLIAAASDRQISTQENDNESETVMVELEHDGDVGLRLLVDDLQKELGTTLHRALTEQGEEEEEEEEEEGEGEGEGEEEAEVEGSNDGEKGAVHIQDKTRDVLVKGHLLETQEDLEEIEAHRIVVAAGISRNDTINAALSAAVRLPVRHLDGDEGYGVDNMSTVAYEEHPLGTVDNQQEVKPNRERTKSDLVNSADNSLTIDAQEPTSLNQPQSELQLPGTERVEYVTGPDVCLIPQESIKGKKTIPAIPFVLMSRWARRREQMTEAAITGNGDATNPLSPTIEDENFLIQSYNSNFRDMNVILPILELFENSARYAEIIQQRPYSSYSIIEPTSNDLLGIVWTAQKQMLHYKQFSDLLFIDTSVASKYCDLTFVLFSMIDYHGETTIVAGGLFDERPGSHFIELLEGFKKILKAHDIGSPVTIITDLHPKLMNAVEEAFPESNHQVSNWKVDFEVRQVFLSRFTDYENFIYAWKKLVSTESVGKMEKRLNKFFDSWPGARRHMNRWLNMKEKFFTCYNIDNFNMDIRTVPRGDIMSNTVRKTFRSLARFDNALNEFDAIFDRQLCRFNRKSYEQLKRHDQPHAKLGISDFAYDIYLNQVLETRHFDMESTSPHSWLCRRKSSTSEVGHMVEMIDTIYYCSCSFSKRYLMPCVHVILVSLVHDVPITSAQFSERWHLRQRLHHLDPNQRIGTSLVTPDESKEPEETEFNSTEDEDEGDSDAEETRIVGSIRAIDERTVKEDELRKLSNALSNRVDWINVIQDCYGIIEFYRSQDRLTLPDEPVDGTKRRDAEEMTPDEEYVPTKRRR